MSATSDYLEQLRDAFGCDISPEARPDLWEFCEECGCPRVAPMEFTGDMCHCHEDEDCIILVSE